jgi:uncharacterized protein
VKDFLFPAIVGLLGGALSGMFGVGGGIIMVPLFVFLLGFAQHKAQGTSLALMLLPTGILAVKNYYEKDAVDLKVAGIAAALFVVGAFLGSKFSLGLEDQVVKKLFGVMLICTGAYYLIRR